MKMAGVELQSGPHQFRQCSCNLLLKKGYKYMCTWVKMSVDFNPSYGHSTRALFHFEACWLAKCESNTGNSKLSTVEL